MAQVGNAFACRTEVNRGRTLGWTSNRFLLIGVVAEILLMIILIYFPPFTTALNLVPLPLVSWLWLIPYGLILYSLDRIRKSLRRSMNQVTVKKKAVI